jgi:aminoglycoside phosphotransferase (APT) family kinase protein
MPEIGPVHSQEWLAYFARTGYEGVRTLAAGVEGAVYHLGDATVAKVWTNRRAPELEGLQRFYADVAATPLPFATPVIKRVAEIDGIAVTFERELPGRPLQDLLSVDDDQLAPAAVDALVEALQGLATIRGTDAMKTLPALDENRPLWAGADDFPTALIALLDRRMARFGHLLHAVVADFDQTYDRLRHRLATLDQVPVRAVHGDLFGGNMLVDDDLRLTAVLDFGFLSTAGDPRLDAAISAAVMNMYGPHAPAITAALTTRLATELSYPVDVLLLYQAAYAVATANSFTDDGNDGHFRWCAEQLARPDIAAALRR